MASSSFDLDAYISNYTGYTRLRRLAFIASKDSSLRTDALRLALDEVTMTTNTALYVELINLATEGGGPFARDDAWVERVERSAHATHEKLEAELSSHKTSLVKESIRMGHNDLGDFFSGRGDFGAALKAYVRTRDYCATAKHVLAMCISVIKVSVHMGNFSHVANYVTKAEMTPEVCDGTVTAQLKVASGLAALMGKKYKQAARKFVEAGVELGSSFSDVISAQDVAVYGSLCALASFDRADLKSKLIENSSFRSFVELVPQVRELVSDFYASRYASCLAYLEKLRPDLELDMHLHSHVKALYDEIRSRALVQYFSPFVTVDLNRMAAAFNSPVGQLESELAALIMGGKISARIDSHNKVLHARHADKRHATFDAALAMGGDYARDAKALLLRLNLMRADFIVKGAAGSEGYPSAKSSRQERAERAGGGSGRRAAPAEPDGPVSYR